MLSVPVAAEAACLELGRLHEKLEAGLGALCPNRHIPAITVETSGDPLRLDLANG